MTLSFSDIFEQVRPLWPTLIELRSGRREDGERLGFNYDDYEDMVRIPYSTQENRSFLGESMNWAIFSALPWGSDTNITIDEIDRRIVKEFFDRNVRSYVEQDLPDEPESERDMEAYVYVQNLDAG